eukprot:g14737.t1
MFEDEPGKSHGDSAELGLTPGNVVGLLPACGWRLGSCWEPECDCLAFEAAAGQTPGCTCGHRSGAHELVDANDVAEETPLRPTRYRHYPGGEDSSSVDAAAADETGARLRRLFSAIRNARAVGDCGLFEDSEGVGGWGSGWFLSRLARRYIHQARQAIAALGGALHDPPAVARCLAAAEALLSGDAVGEWTIPNSLPSSLIYKALGTGIASELDLAYWHVRYTAASRFDAGCVTANPSSSFHVVPPPEVYFVGLAFHVPSVAELRALPLSPALWKTLADVFDIPVGHAEVAGRPSSVASPGRSASTNAGLHAGNSGGGGRGGEIVFPVLTNPLLAVAQSAWLETAASSSARSWVPHFPPRFGDNEGTMRGSDPGLPPPVRARCDATRDWAARLLAFAVPNRRAVSACRRALEACRVGGQEQHEGSAAAEVGVVEVGAGLGYWKWVLQGGGSGAGGCGSSSGGGAKGRSLLKFLAIDKDPPRLPTTVSRGNSADCAGRERRVEKGGIGKHRGGRAGGKKGRGRRARNGATMRVSHNEYHGGAPGWAEVEKGGPERLRSLSAAAYPVLLLCYPPPSIGSSSGDDVGAGCMGAEALASFSGKVLLYIGEVGGDTGSPRLEAALQASWNLVEDVDLPCFSSTANRLMVFIRKGAAAGISKKNKQWCPPPAAAAAAAAAATDGGSLGGADGVWGQVVPLYRCSGCGVAATAPAAGEGKKARLHRCRLTRASSYCSEKCLALDDERWRARLEARHIHLAAGSAAEVARHCGSYGGVFRDKKLFKRLAM